VPLRDVFPLIGALRKTKRITDARRVWDQAVLVAGMQIFKALRIGLVDGGFESGVTEEDIPGYFRRACEMCNQHRCQEKHTGNHSLR